MTNYLEVKNLSKSFDSFQLHNITFTLPKGYIMGLIGPNGSGKTTTIKLILNMLKRNGGEIKIMGLDNIADEQKAKAELGVVFDTNYFSDDWKVSEVEKSISVFYPNQAADMLHHSFQELWAFRQGPGHTQRDVIFFIAEKLENAMYLPTV